jgi:hypothetical protein
MFVVGFEVFTAVVMKSIIFWDIMPCSPFAELFFDLKMEAIRSSETSGATQRTTRRHIPEDDTPGVSCLLKSGNNSNNTEKAIKYK